MKIEIVRPLSWLWEKGQPVWPTETMAKTFRNAKGLVLKDVALLEIDGRPKMYGISVEAFRKACYNQHRVSVAVELRPHWNRLGFVDSTIIGIPADCCQVLEDKKT